MMGGTTAARDARRAAVAKIVAAAGDSWSVESVIEQLASDYGIAATRSPIYQDLSALKLAPPKRPGAARDSRTRATTKAPFKRRPARSPGAKPAAEGYQRTNFDLPEQLYIDLKMAAVLERRTMRGILEEATRAWLAKR